MTLLSSRRQNTANIYCNTSTHETQTYIYHGGTGPRWNATIPGYPGFPQAPTTPSLPQSTERPCMQINIYIGTATTSLWLNTVYSTPWHIGPKSVYQPTNTTKELEHIRKALQACSFPPWTLNKLQYKFNHKHNINNGQSSMINQPNNNNNNNNSSGSNNSNNNKNISIVIPYMQGLGERFNRTCNNKGIQVHFKVTNTLNSLSWHLKTQITNYKRVG